VTPAKWHDVRRDFADFYSRRAWAFHQQWIRARNLDVREIMPDLRERVVGDLFISQCFEAQCSPDILGDA